MPWIWWVFFGFSLRTPGFDTKSHHLCSVVDNIKLATDPVYCKTPISLQIPSMVLYAIQYQDTRTFPVFSSFAWELQIGFYSNHGNDEHKAVAFVTVVTGRGSVTQKH